MADSRGKIWYNTRMNIKCLFAVFALASACATAQNVDALAMERAKAILSRMTLEEKVSLCAGSGTMSLPAIPRLGIMDEWKMSDNSQTVRADMERWTWNCTSTNDEATVLPNLSALASTWSVDLAARFGHVMGEQARARGKDMMLGPGVNIMRTPLCGRNWEYFSEDPVLTAKLVVPEIKAMQSHDVAACVKHFCVNSQENDRFNNDAVLDDRTLNEIYLPAFRAAVKEAGVYALMTSYNLYNGQRCSQHMYLLKGILRERWGFDGLVVTDWGGQRSTVKSALSGAGTEMNRGSDIRYLANPSKGTYPLADAVRAGQVPGAFVDEKALRVLYTMARTNFLDPAKRKGGERLTERHRKEALAIAEEAVTLLKNDAGTLPLNPAKMKKVLLVGKLADTEMTKKGWSAEGKPLYEITPYKGIVEYFAGRNVAIERAPLVASDGADSVHPVIESSIGTFDTTAMDAGMSVRAWQTEWYSGVTAPTGTPFKVGFSRQPGFDLGTAAPFEGMDTNCFCVVWRTKLIAPETGDYAFACELDHRAESRIVIDGATVAAGRELGRISGQAALAAGETYDLSVVYIGDTGEHKIGFGWQLPSERGTIEELRAKAESADAVLVFTGTEVGHGRALECEGGDRPDMKLPVGHDEAIARILSWKIPGTVVVNHSGSPVEMPWVGDCPTLVQQPYLGQEAGRALARVLFGDVNPSGKLPCTWPYSYADTGVARLGELTPKHSIYNERFYVGYRWFDAMGIKPMFPFGYGLSYTVFEYKRLKASREDGGFEVSVKVENAGSVAGKESVQLYATYPDTGVERCVAELKAFAKTGLLEPGDGEKLTMFVGYRDLAYWDDVQNRFTTPAGVYKLLVGSSSRDIRGSVDVTVRETMVFDD